MSLLEELIADSGRHTNECSVGRWLSTLPDAERSDWESAFSNRAITAAAIIRALDRRNVDLGDNPIQRHAKRIRSGTGCKCPR